MATVIEPVLDKEDFDLTEFLVPNEKMEKVEKKKSKKPEPKKSDTRSPGKGKPIPKNSGKVAKKSPPKKKSSPPPRKLAKREVSPSFERGSKTPERKPWQNSQKKNKKFGPTSGKKPYVIDVGNDNWKIFVSRYGIHFNLCYGCSDQLYNDSDKFEITENYYTEEPEYIAKIRMCEKCAEANIAMSSAYYFNFKKNSKK